MFNGRGERIALLGTTPPPGEPALDEREESMCAAADMTGNGVPDILLWANPGSVIYIYENKHGRKPETPPSSGSDNYTFY
jgi:hypothetical protein